MVFVVILLVVERWKLAFLSYKVSSVCFMVGCGAQLFHYYCYHWRLTINSWGNQSTIYSVAEHDLNCCRIFIHGCCQWWLKFLSTAVNVNNLSVLHWINRFITAVAYHYYYYYQRNYHKIIQINVNANLFTYSNVIVCIKIASAPLIGSYTSNGYKNTSIRYQYY